MTECPAVLLRWANLMEMFSGTLGWAKRAGMMQMLQELGLKHEGHHHSGIDDCKNIARILRHLVTNHRLVVRFTDELIDDPATGSTQRSP